MFIHNFLVAFNIFNCGVRGNRVLYVLWQVHDLRRFSSLRNIVKLCNTNILYQDSPEDIANGHIKIASCFKQGKFCQCFHLCHSSSWWYIFDKSPPLKRNKWHFKIIMFCKSYQLLSIQIKTGFRWVALLNLFISTQISCTWWKREILF